MVFFKLLRHWLFNKPEREPYSSCQGTWLFSGSSFLLPVSTVYMSNIVLLLAIIIEVSTVAYFNFDCFLTGALHLILHVA